MPTSTPTDPISGHDSTRRNRRTLDRSFRGARPRYDRPDLARTGLLDLKAASSRSLVLDGTLRLKPGQFSHTTLLARTGDAVDFTAD